MPEFDFLLDISLFKKGLAEQKTVINDFWDKAKIILQGSGLLDAVKNRIITENEMIRLLNFSLSAISDSGREEAEEEGGIDNSLAPEKVLHRIHYSKTGKLFIAPLHAPLALGDIDINDRPVEHIRNGLLAFGLGCQILDDLSDLGSERDMHTALKELNPNLPGHLKIQTWDQLMPDLLQLIDMNEIAMRIMILFIFILVGFGISNSFILTIVERFREFGILKAMGVTPKELVGLIFLESFMVCFMATLIGLAMGWILTHIIAYNGIDFSSLTSHNRYFIASGLVRPRATLESLYWPGLLSIIVSIVSSYLPTRIAAGKATAETLRFS